MKKLNGLTGVWDANEKKFVKPKKGKFDWTKGLLTDDILRQNDRYMDSVADNYPGSLFIHFEDYED